MRNSFIVFPRLRLRVSVFALPSMLVMLWIEGAAPFLILMLSATVHEIGHLAAMRLLGYRPRRIDILPMGAVIVCPESISYGDETVIALCGPLSSIALSGIAICIYSADRSVYMLFLAFVNLLLGSFNMLPIEKLDGGKALKCFLLYKNNEGCDRACSIASKCAKALVFLFAVISIVLSGYNFGVILLTLALLMQL